MPVMDREPQAPYEANLSVPAGSAADSVVVDSTGIALVHEGEIISAPVDAQARLAKQHGAPVSFRFPVEMQIVGSLDETELQEICDRVFRELELALSSQE